MNKIPHQIDIQTLEDYRLIMRPCTKMSEELLEAMFRVYPEETLIIDRPQYEDIITREPNEWGDLTTLRKPEDGAVIMWAGRRRTYQGRFSIKFFLAIRYLPRYPVLITGPSIIKYIEKVVSDSPQSGDKSEVDYEQKDNRPGPGPDKSRNAGI